MITAFFVLEPTLRSAAYAAMVAAWALTTETDVSVPPQLSGAETMRQTLTAPRSTQQSETILVHHQQGSIMEVTSVGV